jgi:DNA-directed RNA polymerase specialized sigma24 family protein
MSEDKPAEQSGSFPVTRWTLVARLQGPATPEAAQALDAICVAYWYPLYVFARRFGLEEPDAKDAVQELFHRMIKGDRFALAREAEGRLRSYLLSVLKNVIAASRQRQQTLKRGGEEELVSLDTTDAEGRYLHDPVSTAATPEQAYERKWAMNLLHAAKADLCAAYTAEGKTALFELLAPALDEGDRWSGHAAACETLQMNEGALRTALHRLRKRYRDSLFKQVRATVERDEDVKAEAAHLMQLFSQ